jgi:hypothetical protein
MKGSLFWDMTPGGSTLRDALVATCFDADFLLGLFFDPENGTSDDFQGTTRHYAPEDRTLHNHRCENLKSYKSHNNNNNLVW